MTGLVSGLILILFLFLIWFYLDSVNLSSHRRAYLLFLVLIIAATLPLPIFAGFFKISKLVLKRSEFLGPDIWFLGPVIFHWRALSRGFGSCGAIALHIVLISLIGIRPRPESSFCLSVDRFWTILLKLSRSWPRYSISTLTKDFSASWKYQIIAPFFGASSELNSINMDYKYMNWAA